MMLFMPAFAVLLAFVAIGLCVWVLKKHVDEKRAEKERIRRNIPVTDLDDGRVRKIETKKEWEER